MVVYVKRPGGQQQYSDQLRFQTSSVPKVRDLVHFVHSHLDHDLGVERLAGDANLSVRQFTRRFRAALGMPPAEFVERARLGEGVRRLVESQVRIDAIARSVGYRSRTHSAARFAASSKSRPRNIARGFARRHRFPLPRRRDKAPVT